MIRCATPQKPMTASNNVNAREPLSPNFKKVQVSLGKIYPLATTRLAQQQKAGALSTFKNFTHPDIGYGKYFALPHPPEKGGSIRPSRVFTNWRGSKPTLARHRQRSPTGIGASLLWPYSTPVCRYRHFPISITCVTTLKKPEFAKRAPIISAYTILMFRAGLTLAQFAEFHYSATRVMFLRKDCGRPRPYLCWQNSARQADN